MADTIRDTDIGTEFKVTMKLIGEDGVVSIFNISTYTTLEIEFLENNGTTIVVKTAAFKVSGVDGVLTFTNPDTTLLLNKSGLWHYRGHVAKTSNDYRNQNWIPFKVLKSTE